jgi:mRNA interferase HigB
MRIIAAKTLKKYWEKFTEAKQSLLSWYEEAETAFWNSPNNLKEQYRLIKGTSNLLLNKHPYASLERVSGKEQRSLSQ